MKFIEVALCDGNSVTIDEEFELIVRMYRWKFRTPGSSSKQLPYVVAHFGGKQQFLHRLVADAKAGQIVDHINGNRLDNRACNLRFVSHEQNMRNRKKHADGSHSSFKGVSRFKNGKWRALIRNGKKQLYLGTFDSEVSAAYAYDVASIEIHGEYGRRNFLPLVAASMATSASI